MQGPSFSPHLPMVLTPNQAKGYGEFWKAGLMYRGPWSSEGSLDTHLKILKEEGPIKVSSVRERKLLEWW